MLDPRSLIDGYFDDVLTPAQHTALSDWIKADPQNAQLFAQAALLHDRLRDSLNNPADQAAAGQVAKPAVSLGGWRPFSSASWWSTAASILVLLAGLAALWFSVNPSPASAAFRELDRIIVNSIQSKDRTFEIVVEDISTPARRGKRSFAPEEQRPPKPPLDGATLHVREGNQFVLIRKASDGQPVITGCNGYQSWAVNARGPVRVSADVHHFDHDLPGHETSVPLTNLHEGLEQLKQAYHLQFSTLGPEEYEAQVGETVRMLVAVKKPKERGPQRVEIAYDSNTGRILHMRFIQMPYGPDRLDLRLTLLNENRLPVDFFEHISHHTPGRNIETEN